MAVTSNRPIVIDQGDDATVAITTPTGLSLAGIVSWDLRVGAIRGGPASATYVGAASTVNGVTTITWTIPASATAVAATKWAVARASYGTTKRTFYRCELQIISEFSN